MLFSINPSSGIPLYRQILQQLRERILGGQVNRGEQLPSVRELSAQLGINPLTVAKVYQYLERDGLVETRRGQGTFVAMSVREVPASARKKHLEPALRQLVTEALHVGMDEEELGRLLTETFQKIKTEDNP